MKICLASWAPFLAGAEVAAERLAVGLQAAGHQVLVLLGTRGETLGRMERAGLRCRCVPMATTDKWKPWRYLRARRAIERVLSVERPEVIHANDLPTSQMVAQAAGKLGIPRICHHRWVFDGPAIDWLNKFGAERHLFVSRALMDQLASASQLLRLSQRAVVHDGLPLPALPNDDDRLAARAQLGLPSDKVLVTIAGQVIPRKGHADLLHAWAGLSPAVAGQAQLLVVGEDLENDGAARRDMERLAGELSVPARFVGFQKNVDTWLTASNLVVVPSHVEPLGNATLEAMALGRPVIGSDVGGIPEMIVDGQTGLLVPPKSPAALAAALERLISDRQVCRQLGQAGRLRCEQKFSLQAHVDQVLQQYQAVLAGDEASTTPVRQRSSTSSVPGR